VIAGRFRVLSLQQWLKHLISKCMYNVGIELDAKIVVDGVHGLRTHVSELGVQKFVTKRIKF